LQVIIRHFFYGCNRLKSLVLARSAVELALRAKKKLQAPVSLALRAGEQEKREKRVNALRVTEQLFQA
jgi:hypothetical protein